MTKPLTPPKPLCGVVLHHTRGRSAEYRVSLLQVDGTFEVEFQWGQIGKGLQSKTERGLRSLANAKAVYREKVEAKIKGGYQRITGVAEPDLINVNGSSTSPKNPKDSAPAETRQATYKSAAQILSEALRAGEAQSPSTAPLQPLNVREGEAVFDDI